MEWQDVGVYLPLFTLYEAHNLQNWPLLVLTRRSERMTEFLADVSDVYWESTTPRPMEQMQRTVSVFEHLASEYGPDAPVSSITEKEKLNLPRVPELLEALDRLDKTHTKRDARGRLSEIHQRTIADTLQALTEAMALRKGKGRKRKIDVPSLSRQLSVDYEWLTGRLKKVQPDPAVLTLRDFKTACFKPFGIPATENLVRGREQRRARRP